MNITAVVQARMASQRLPGKVLKNLKGWPALGWVVRAARKAHGVNQVVVATSTNQENDVIEDWCNITGVDCFRGSEDDVLSRYIGVLDKYGGDACVRLTADCPLLDSRVIGEVVSLFRATGVDYASNVEPPAWPDGLDCEVFTAEAIRYTDQEADDPVDRDCLTQFIIRNRAIFPQANLSCPLPGMVKERWVLDSPEDYQLLTEIFNAFPEDWHPNYLEIKDFLDSRPELRKINTNWWRNQRFFGSVGSQKSPPKSYLHSQRALARAKKVIPFGAQTFSKSTMFFPETDFPSFCTHGDGGYIFDADGNRFVDLVGALGPNILGYRDPDVDWAVRQQLDRGVTFSLSTELEAQLAEKLIRLIPCAEMCKFGKNGSDVTGAAVKIARAYTGRDKIAKVDDGYHGWHDWTMATDNAGRTKGIPKVLLERIDYPDIGKCAAVVINPEGYDHDYLDHLRKRCNETGTLLIFDEIITGFRYNLGGYQAHCGVTPDLACFGKSMANGYPISALVGKRRYMEVLEDPKVFWSGTFFGEAVSLAAALATIEKMEGGHVLHHIRNMAQVINMHVGDLIGMYVSDKISIRALEEDKIKFHRSVRSRLEFGDKDTHQKFMQLMAREGVLILNSHMLCYAHKEDEVARICTAYDNVLKELANDIRLSS